jgi:hypothetical protein
MPNKKWVLGKNDENYILHLKKTKKPYKKYPNHRKQVFKVKHLEKKKVKNKLYPFWYN